MKLITIFAVNALGYFLIYLSYEASRLEPRYGLLVWEASAVIGTLVGGYLGRMWFR